VAGFAASAKSTTLLNFCEIGPELVQYFVDSTPMKHGRFTPGTGIPIIDPRADSRAPDVYLLGAHNYLGPVMRREQFAGQWLVPIPIPVLL
jgi:methylation protein EvaC